MRLTIFIFLLMNLVGCKEVAQSTRQNYQNSAAEDILVTNSGGGNFGFKLKLPEGFDLLDGNTSTTTIANGEDNAPILSDSPFIKFECNGTINGNSLTQINVGLKNLSTSKNYVARFEYVCAEGANLKLVNLVSGEKYQLTVHVINSKGIIYQGQSEVFTTASEKIVLKMVRVQKNDTVEVDIVFPTDPQPVAASRISCLFTRDSAVVADALKPTGSDGNLANDIVSSGPGGNCSVASIGIVPLPATNAPSSCVSSGASCDVSLGVLKSVAVFKVEISSKACVKDKADVHYVTLHPGQRAIVKACKVATDPVPPTPTPAQFCNENTVSKIPSIEALLEKIKLRIKYKTVHCGILHIGDHLQPGIGGHVPNVTRICHREGGNAPVSTWITGDTVELTAQLKTLAANKDLKIVCIATNKDAPASIEGSALPIQEIKVLGPEPSTGTSSNTGTGAASTTANCATNPVFDANETFKTPLNVAHGTGDMGRNNMSGATKDTLVSFVNPICGKNILAANSAQNPAVGSDKNTRDMVCRLHGYAAATDDNSFGYYQYASPGNNVGAYWDVASKTYTPTGAKNSPIGNRLLVWTSCKGKLYDICRVKYISDEFKCK